MNLTDVTYAGPELVLRELPGAPVVTQLAASAEWTQLGDELSGWCGVC